MGCTPLALGVAWRKESCGGKNNCPLDVYFSFKLSTIILVVAAVKQNLYKKEKAVENLESLDLMVRMT